MAITYHAGRRIQATQADFDGIPAVIGGWKELGRTTAGAAGDTISVSSLPDKRYYMVLQDLVQDTANINSGYRLNGDSGSNYSFRRQQNGGVDGTDINQASLTINGGGNYTTGIFTVGYWANLSGKEKLQIGHSVYGATGAGNAPMRGESAGKWTNTSNPISTIAGYNSSGGNYATGSEVVVLGWDPSDTHTTNFWEELGSDVLSSQSNQLDVSGMTAKKYLWYQAFIKKNATASNYAEHSINGITTGSTWARRLSSDGGADGTSTSQNTINTTDTGAGGYFLNGFVINNSGNEKLFIEHIVQNLTAGAGTAPNRKEASMKCTTSAQITQLTISGATNGYEAGSFIKVWGSN